MRIPTGVAAFGNQVQFFTFQTGVVAMPVSVRSAAGDPEPRQHDIGLFAGLLAGQLRSY